MGGGALLKLNVLVDCSSTSKACNSKDVILKGIAVDGEDILKATAAAVIQKRKDSNVLKGCGWMSVCMCVLMETF